MCNVCNSWLYGRGGYGCGCGGNTTVNTVNTYGNGRNLCGYNQRMCRDACGNILTRNVDACRCQAQCCCCPCYHHCGCGNNGGNGGTAGNNGNGTTGGNGIFRCVTFCGYGTGFGNGTTQTTGVNGTPRASCVDNYYARQYGLTCDGNAECVYNF